MKKPMSNKIDEKWIKSMVERKKRAERKTLVEKKQAELNRVIVCECGEKYVKIVMVRHYNTMKHKEHMWSTL